jgi:branched-chain amino acid transport system substrate-binding protein
MTLMLAAWGLAALGCEKREATGESVASVQKAPEEKAPADDAPGVTDTTIKIGSYGPLSGPAAAWGAVLHGMNAYFSYINDQGGVHGRKIDFVFRDDQYNPSKTPAIVRELVEKEQVFALVGGIGTANGRAVADYLEEKNVPFFTPSSGDKFWSDPGKKNVYTVFPRYVTEGEILGTYAVKELSAKSVGVFFQEDDFGKQGLEGVEKGVKAAGGEIVVSVSCQPTDTDVSGQVSQIVAKKPDVLVLYSAPKQAIAAVKTLESQKKKPKIVTSFVLSDPILFKLAGDTWNGAIAAAAGVLPTEESEPAKLYREVLEKYADKQPVGNFTLAGFQFAMPFVEALNRAVKDLTRNKVYEALNSFKSWRGPALHWKGDRSLGPPITFSEKQRLGNQKIYLIQAKDGKWDKITDWLSAG